MALQLGATFVARSFSGDKTQLVPIIKAAIEHQRRGVHRRDQPLRGVQQPRRLDQEFRLCARAQRGREPARFHDRPRPDHGRLRARHRATVEQHDGTTLVLRKINADYDVHDRLAAMNFLQHHAAKGQVVTGLLTSTPSRTTCTHLNTTRHRSTRSARKSFARAPQCWRIQRESTLSGAVDPPQRPGSMAVRRVRARSRESS